MTIILICLFISWSWHLNRLIKYKYLSAEKYTMTRELFTIRNWQILIFWIFSRITANYSNHSLFFSHSWPHLLKSCMKVDHLIKDKWEITGVLQQQQQQQQQQKLKKWKGTKQKHTTQLKRNLKHNLKRIYTKWRHCINFAIFNPSRPAHLRNLD